MSNWKYKYRIKRKLGFSQYLSLLNYIQSYNSEKKSFRLTFNSFIRLIRNLLFNSKLYINKPETPDRKSYFIDFDCRNDHLNKINSYVDRLKLGKISRMEMPFGINNLVTSNRFRCLRKFFSLLFLALYISIIKKLNVFYVLEALAKFSQNYSLGECLATKIEIDNIFSLNLQTSIGFVFGLKSVNENIRVIVIQHGFITKLDGASSTKWRDYYSDYFICWSSSFKTIALTRFSSKCNIIVDGGVFNVDEDAENLSSAKVNHNKLILFLSSFSKYTNDAILNQEIKAIYRLHELCERSSYHFIVRLHPSVQCDSSFLPDYIQVDLPQEISLEESIRKASVTCTISSSSIIACAKMKKDIMVLESVNENILNLSLKTVDIYSNDCIHQLVSNNSQKLKDLNFMFGVQTNNIENIPRVSL